MSSCQNPLTMDQRATANVLPTQPNERNQPNYVIH